MYVAGSVIWAIFTRATPTLNRTGAGPQTSLSNMAQAPQLNQTLFMIRGDTREWSFAVIDENKSAVPLPGATGYFTAKFDITDADSAAVFKLTETNGITFDSGSGGTGSIKLVPANTSSVPDIRTTLVFDFQIKVSGNTYTVARGNLIVDPDVTTT